MTPNHESIIGFGQEDFELERVQLCSVGGERELREHQQRHQLPVAVGAQEDQRALHLQLVLLVAAEQPSETGMCIHLLRSCVRVTQPT